MDKAGFQRLVSDPEYPGAIKDQGIGQGPGLKGAQGVSRNQTGFINDQEGLVFKKEKGLQERVGQGKGIQGAGDFDLQTVPGRQPEPFGS
jgi:hypothetical protein